ncbi:MAG: 30S ribosomal protein S12 methylthiotransferase RimO [Vicinamibacterales bacterium]|nr:30S ribosomal protein S12 methylthiotransferase RimO [Vicinamibacterales bacterium]
MKIGLISLGCPKNLVDSEVMLGLAAREGHQLTRDAAEADVLVVNTCAFIDGAKRESIDTILEMAEHKKTGRCTKLVVTGCMAERYRDELLEQIPEIDAVLGTGQVPDIVRVLGTGAPTAFTGATATIPLLRADGTAVGQTGPVPDARTASGLPTYLYDADTPRLLATPRHYAYVKIAEGCDYSCGFCIIPPLRGHYRSRPVASIVQEAQQLAAGGVRELLLISQDTTFYGIDRGERRALVTLLRALDQVEGLEWIRLLYLYPTTITDAVLDAIADSRKVCRYIDLPLQHASDAVLKRMRRPGTRASYLKLLEKIRTRLPGVTLRTTFIVGYPGETDEDFEALQAFVREVQFDHVGVFTYSHEEGTPAFALTDDVPAAVKTRRQRQLMKLQQGIVARAQKRRIGDRIRLVVDGPAAEHELVLRARTVGQAPDIDPQVYLTECDPSEFSTGQFIEAEITGSQGYDLLARPLSVPVPV